MVSFFSRFYNSDEHLEKLFNSLVKTSLAREDVANMEKENFKNSHEVRQSFRNTRKAHDSYLYRTSVELVLAIVILVIFSGFSGITGMNDPLFDCDVHGILFRCVIPNTRFYKAVYVIAFFQIVAYLTLTIYNLFWLLHPRVGKLECVLANCK